jgi:SWI/SNF-related matrix-associated actin-dependent regulator of chromatin subfamily A member 5
MTTTESSIAGDLDGRKKRWEGHELRKTVLGKKHDKLGESKVPNTLSE